MQLINEIENSTIDENLFVEAIALCASEIDDNISANMMDKVTHAKLVIIAYIYFREDG
jgi:hypothetical protein